MDHCGKGAALDEGEEPGFACVLSLTALCSPKVQHYTFVSISAPT
jgi:hypothetical protein